MKSFFLFRMFASNALYTDIGLGVLRVFAGIAMALGHGWKKLPPSEDFVDNVGEMGFPVPIAFAWAAALSEFVGGLLLALGLATRAAALFILGTMVVAAFIRHGGDGFSGQEKALLYAVISLLFLFAGGGRFSVDNCLHHKSN